MKSISATAFRVAITGVTVILAAFAAWRLWDNYTTSPWTRDARVRADVVSLAPDVSGLVDSVAVDDNAVVRKGDVLFTVDRSRFTIALERADAAVDAAEATRDRTATDLVRTERLLGTATTEKQRDEARESAAKADADYRSAVSQRAAAALDLERAQVQAPHNGVITNLSLHAGDYAVAGKAVMALVDSDTFRVEGYFEETKLPGIRIGAAAEIKLLGRPSPISGHVKSIAAGIEDRERSDTTGSLANINPSYNWVRLAQRVPVIISVDAPRDGTPLVAGLSATVAIKP
ncbi:efflux RND transporter periplasmic adaptor subunit [Ensifer sp. R-19]|uniref:efflux RND transporter periplasmic adaptor subunit n=1 Tax=Ensifer sp. R-19 TaxID=3404055 RepID=UPI003CF0334B